MNKFFGSVYTIGDNVMRIKKTTKNHLTKRNRVEFDVAHTSFASSGNMATF
jgi:hypothetical protein